MSRPVPRLVSLLPNPETHDRQFLDASVCRLVLPPVVPVVPESVVHRRQHVVRHSGPSVRKQVQRGLVVWPVLRRVFRVLRTVFPRVPVRLVGQELPRPFLEPSRVAVFPVVYQVVLKWVLYVLPAPAPTGLRVVVDVRRQLFRPLVRGEVRHRLPLVVFPVVRVVPLRRRQPVPLLELQRVVPRLPLVVPREVFLRPEPYPKTVPSKEKSLLSCVFVYVGVFFRPRTRSKHFSHLERRLMDAAVMGLVQAPMRRVHA